MSDLRIWNRTVQSATFPSHIFAQAVREWIAAATEMMEPASEPAKVECEEEGKWTGNVKCPDCGRLVNEAHCGGPNHVYQRVRPAQPEPVAHEDAEFMRAGAMSMARIIERDEQPEPSDTDADHEVAWREFKGQPEPVAEVKGVRFEDWPAAQERAIAEIESRPQVDGGQRIGGNKPEPVAAEMPEAVSDALKSLRAVATLSEHQGILYRRADALESFWRTHAAKPAKVRMSPEIEELLRWARDAAGNVGSLPYAEAEEDEKRIRMMIDKVRTQAAEATDASAVYDKGFADGIALQKKCGAEAGKVRMPKVLDMLNSALAQTTLQVRQDEFLAALAELDAAAGVVLQRVQGATAAAIVRAVQEVF